MYKINQKRKKQKGGNNKIIVKTGDNELIELEGLILKESELLKILTKGEWKRDQTIKLDIPKKILTIIDHNENIDNYDLETLVEIAKTADYLSMKNYIDKVTTIIADNLKKQIA